MRAAIAIIMAILGTVLVFSGAAAMWATALTRSNQDGPEAATPISPTSRRLAAMSQLPSPDKLIIWGTGLLAIAAISSGAIQFSVAASAGTH